MSQTERLYYQDSRLTEFEASVVAAEANPAGVVLDRTAFYPTGGGQPHDTGWLDDMRVVDCIDREDAGVLHVLEGPLPRIGAGVRGRVDWPRRFDHLQQHTGQHILSQAFVELYDAETRGFRIMERAAEIDVALDDPTDERLARAVDRANEIVWENRPLHTRFVSADEARTLPLRKESARQGELRLVEIENFDLNACGGTHARRTGEVGLIALRSWQRAKGLVRLEFVAGGRALADYRAANNVARAVAALLGVGRDDAFAAAKRLSEDHKLLARRVRGFEEEALRAEAESWLPQAAVRGSDGARVVVRILTGQDLNALKQLAQSLITHAHTIVLLASGGENSAAQFLFARSAEPSDDMSALLRRAVTPLAGRGGGSASFAQGGGRATPEELAETMSELQGQVMNGAEC